MDAALLAADMRGPHSVDFFSGARSPARPRASGRPEFQTLNSGLRGTERSSSARGAIPIDRSPAARAPDPQALAADRAAQAFEAMTLAQLLAPIFSSIETPKIAGAGPGERAFQSLLQEEYAKAIAARGGVGLADAVRKALLEMQAAQSAASNR